MPAWTLESSRFNHARLVEGERHDKDSSWLSRTGELGMRTFTPPWLKPLPITVTHKGLCITQGTIRPK